jgi:hypothetical protein
MKRWLVGLTATAMLSASGCAEETAVDAYYGLVAYRVLPDVARGAELAGGARGFQATTVLQGGVPSNSFDFGPVGTDFDSVYLVFRGGRPLESQYPIMDKLPGDDGYSSLHRVVRVDVDDAYEANDIKSLKTLKAAFGGSMSATNLLMNCPVVNPDARFLTANGEQIQRFYGDGEPAANVRSTASSTPVIYDEDAEPSEVVLQPVWVRRLLAYCWMPRKSQRYSVTGDGVAESPPRWNEFVSALPEGEDVSGVKTDRLPTTEASEATYFEVFAVVENDGSGTEGSGTEGSGAEGSGTIVTAEKSLGWYSKIVLPIGTGGAQ